MELEMRCILGVPCMMTAAQCVRPPAISGWCDTVCRTSRLTVCICRTTAGPHRALLATARYKTKLTVDASVPTPVLYTGGCYCCRWQSNDYLTCDACVT